MKLCCLLTHSSFTEIQHRLKPEVSVRHQTSTQLLKYQLLNQRQEGGILSGGRGFLGFKMYCESLFIFLFSSLALSSSSSSPGFLLLSFNPPPLVSSLALSSNSHGFLLPLFHFHPPHAWLCCLATPPHLQTDVLDDLEESLWHPSILANCTIRLETC